jgi:hypothetical protein
MNAMTYGRHHLDVFDVIRSPGLTISPAIGLPRGGLGALVPSLFPSALHRISLRRLRLAVRRSAACTLTELSTDCWSIAPQIFLA